MPQSPASSLSVARRLARFVSGFSLAAVPPDVAARATLLALDTLGSCLASSRQAFGRAVSDAAGRLGGPPESEERQDHPRGGPDFPMTREELTAKFRGNAAEAIPDAQASRVIALVEALAAQPRVAPLMDALTA